MTRTITLPLFNKMIVSIIRALVIHKKISEGGKRKKHENNITIKTCRILEKGVR